MRRGTEEGIPAGQIENAGILTHNLLTVSSLTAIQKVRPALEEGDVAEKKMEGTGDIVRKGLIMVLSQVAGVTKTFEGITGLKTGPFAVFFELGDSHPQKGKQLYYSIGYSVTERRHRRHDPLDVLEMRAHAHETDASRSFLGNFEGFICETFPCVETLRPELLDTETAKRVYRWWLPVYHIIRYATCENPDG